MSWGDSFILLKWIDQFKEGGKVRRAKKLTALRKDLERVNEDIAKYKIFKSATDSNNYKRLLVAKRVLEEKIRSMAG